MSELTLKEISLSEVEVKSAECEVCSGLVAERVKVSFDDKTSESVCLSCAKKAFSTSVDYQTCTEFTERLNAGTIERVATTLEEKEEHYDAEVIEEPPEKELGELEK